MIGIVFGYFSRTQAIATCEAVARVTADQFGVNSLARAMAVILPVNTIGQTWFPYFVSILRDRFGSYWTAMGAVLAVALIGALSIAILPRHRAPEDVMNEQPVPAR